MAKLNRRRIDDAAHAVLERHPGGVRWAEVLKAVASAHPYTPLNSIRGATHQLFQRGDGIVKIARGTYQLAHFAEIEPVEAPVQGEAGARAPASIDQVSPAAATPLEQDFYPSFAEWLEENDEVTVAAPLGGSSLGGKWGTPDVIGVLRPARRTYSSSSRRSSPPRSRPAPANPWSRSARRSPIACSAIRATSSCHAPRRATT